jgi:hypothetical protein
MRVAIASLLGRVLQGGLLAARWHASRQVIFQPIRALAAAATMFATSTRSTRCSEMRTVEP